jgi:hypothetical protein
MTCTVAAIRVRRTVLTPSGLRPMSMGWAATSQGERLAVDEDETARLDDDFLGQLGFYAGDVPLLAIGLDECGDDLTAAVPRQLLRRVDETHVYGLCVDLLVGVLDRHGSPVAVRWCTGARPNRDRTTAPRRLR